MAILGRGRAHGACSLLHAAGTGYGASMSLDLPLAIRLLDKPSKRQLDDGDQILSFVVQSWQKAGHELPIPEEDINWAVQSMIPIAQGLKSSSALCVAAVRALCDATETDLELADIVSIAVDAQLESGITLTGSVDDTWACATPGWKLIDANQPDVRQGILLEGSGPKQDDWDVLIVSRGPREKRPALEDFIPHQHHFIQALNALQEENELVALTMNGRGVIGATGDVKGRIMTNDALVNSARAAGITGSGTAIVIVVPKLLQGILDRLKQWYKSKYPEVELIETNFLNPQNEDKEDETPSS
jgi:shikimate kinase|tara:strand:+ start:556 stop:1461 length:906 start_codon:yes stop_codon:yes gene_type:complete